MLTRLGKLFVSSQRITSSGTWIPEVDGVRFIAIALVMITHVHERVIRRTAEIYPDVAGGLLDQLLRQGDMGVMIFFALSGYILGKGLIPPMDRGEKVSIGRFYLRRLTRLEPPYIVVMVGIFLFLTVTGFRSSHARSFNEGAMSLWDALLASLVYAYGFIYGTFPKLNPPAWSLEIEVQFYLLMPLFAWTLTRLRPIVRVAGLIGAVLAWAWWISPVGWTNPHLKASLVTMLPYFLAGLVAVEMCPRVAEKVRQASWIGQGMAVLAASSFSFLVYGELWASGWHHPPSQALAAGVFLISAMNATYIRPFLAHPLIAVPGGMCYSIYLIHLPLLEILTSLSSRHGQSLPYPLFFTLQFVVLAGIVGAVAWLFFLLVERPCMDREWPQKLYDRLTGLFTARASRR